MGNWLWGFQGRRILVTSPRDHSCEILVKKVTVFCPFLKSLPQVKVKKFGLIPLSEKISKEPSIDCVV